MLISYSNMVCIYLKRLAFILPSWFAILYKLCAEEHSTSYLSISVPNSPSIRKWFHNLHFLLLYRSHNIVLSFVITQPTCPLRSQFCSTVYKYQATIAWGDGQTRSSTIAQRSSSPCGLEFVAPLCSFFFGCVIINQCTHRSLCGFILALLDEWIEVQTSTTVVSFECMKTLQRE